MTDPRPCALARKWWGTCARCGMKRQLEKDAVKSVKCDGMEYVPDPEVDLMLWETLGAEKSDAEPR